MKIISALVVVMQLFLSLMIAGCHVALDHHVNLGYEPILDIKGGAGELFIVTPKDLQLGSSVIGVVRNQFGGRIADVVTDDDVHYWVVSALTHELMAAGYKVNNITQLPENVSKGLDVRNLYCYADTLFEFWSVSAWSTLKFNIDIWKAGVKIKTLNISTEGFEKSALAITPQKREISLTKALQTAMQQSIPEIVNLLEH